MVRKILPLAILATAIMLAAACAEINPPFADPADTALNRQVVAAIGDHAQTVNTTTVGGRVYLEGWILNTAEKNDVIAAIKDVPGVTQIVDNLELTEVGSLGGNDWD